MKKGERGKKKKKEGKKEKWEVKGQTNAKWGRIKAKRAL
jgi:hypothetical protein